MFSSVIQLISRLIILVVSLMPAMENGQMQKVAEGEFLFGIINDDGDHYQDEWDRGVRATTFELHWSMYEPQEGVYDTAYINQRKQRLAELKAQGWYVQLTPGYQYVPDWVFNNYPDMRFVNQYGDAYIPARDSFRVTNAPFNPQARALIAGYLARIFQDFNPADFDSVRIGGVVQGELRYPPADWNGHYNSYWAFDNHAQNPADSSIPAGVVGWRPGLDANPGSTGRGQLIVNPGFEDSHAYYTVPAWSLDDEVSAALTGTNPHGGANALELTITSAHRAHQFVRVTPNTIYNFGGWLRSGNGVGSARLIINQYDANTELIPGAHGLVETNSAGWSEETGSITTVANTRFLKVEIDGSEPGNYFFDDLWLAKDGETNTQDRDIDVPLDFYDWYVQALTDYQNWQVTKVRQYYSGQLDLLYAGKGVRQNQVTDALTNDLTGDGWSESSRGLYAGAAYDQHVSGLGETLGTSLFLTGIEKPAAESVDDSSPYPSQWSAARWIAFLAQSRGMSVWGENSGQNTLNEMYLSAARMLSNGFSGLMWAFESELYSNSSSNNYATIDDYTSIIGTYKGDNQVYIPAIVSPKTQ